MVPVTPLIKSEVHLLRVFQSLLAILCVITVIGNSLVILAVLKDPNRNLKTLSNVFIVNLAIADLMLGFVIEPIYVVLYFNNSVPKVYLKTISSGMALVVEASCLTLVALAVQRWIVVEMPLRARQLLTPKHLKITIAIIWMISALISSLPYMSHRITYKLYDEFLFDVIGSILIITMLCVYSRIYILVRRSSHFHHVLYTTDETERQPLVIHNPGQINRNARTREAKVTQTICIVCGAFIICWMPSVVYTNVNGKDFTILYNFFLMVGLLNSALNPLIYSLRVPKFRQALKIILPARPSSRKEPAK